MDRNKKNAGILMLLMTTVILLVIGCSTDNTPLGPAAAPLQSQNTSKGDIQYPPLTHEFLSHMPGGYEPLSIASAQLDDFCDSIETDRRCRVERNQTVRLRDLVSVTISRGDLSTDPVITIVAPSSCLAVADFYPHPYQFNGTVEITWNIWALNLPRDFDYSQIVPWYVTDTGEFVPLPFRWGEDHERLTVFTNHFSRYIIGQKRK
jgi:hypothetical protein